MDQALVERSGKRELDDELDPDGARRRAEAEARPCARRAPTELPVLTLRGEIDAVLRGEISSSGRCGSGSPIFQNRPSFSRRS